MIKTILNYVAIQTESHTVMFEPFIVSSFSELSKDQILGKITTDSTYKDKLQTSFDVISEIADYIKIENYSDSPSTVDLVYSREDEITSVINAEKNKRLIDYFFGGYADKEEILAVYSKLKQVFETFEKLILVEIYIFVSIISLYNQQFGGNRDLPVAFA